MLVVVIGVIVGGIWYNSKSPYGGFKQPVHRAEDDKPERPSVVWEVQLETQPDTYYCETTSTRIVWGSEQEGRRYYKSEDAHHARDLLEEFAQKSGAGYIPLKVVPVSN